MFRFSFLVVTTVTAFVRTGIETNCDEGLDKETCTASCGVPAVPPDLDLTKRIAVPKIIGGAEAIPHSWPWQVALLTLSGRHACGGTLLNENWVLTAGHCCAFWDASTLRVRVGAHSLANTASEQSSVLHDLSRLIIHPSYVTRPATANDYCLLKLKKSTTFGRETSAICLASEEDATVGTKCFVTGWGETVPRQFRPDNFTLRPELVGAVESRKPSTVLHQVDVTISDQSTCNNVYSGRVEPNMICAGSPGHDACQGDSGGPLVCPRAEGREGFVLVGITSWGIGCARPDIPGVYARVSYATSWITEVIAT